MDSATQLAVSTGCRFDGLLADAVRQQIAALEGDVSEFVHPCVLQALKERLR